MIRCALLLPAPLEAVSGGYAYDRAVLAGLAAGGHAVRAVALAGRYPLVDDAACAAAAAAFGALAGDTLPIIDGLALPAFRDHGDAIAARRTVGLIHHPTSLETGHAAADRDALLTVERHLLPLLTRVIATSATTRERLVSDFGVAAERIAVVVPGTEDVPPSVGSGGPHCAILSVGALVPRKGHDVLLRALAGLFDLDWRLTIVGSATRDPAHAEALRALAAELGIAGQVHFAGEADAATLEALWRGADLFALATHLEGYGMAIAEALKRGLPVAVTGGGAAGQLVTPESGVVCEPGDVTTLSKSLRRLIFDRDLRRMLAEGARSAGRLLPDWPAQCRLFADTVAAVP